MLLALLLASASAAAASATAVPPPCPHGAAGYDLSAMDCAAPGPVAAPQNGSILAPFCAGDYKGKCGGGMGNWWSPSVAVLGGGVVVVTALGKSSTNTAHATPTFVQSFRSTDSGHTFGPPTTLLPENGTRFAAAAAAARHRHRRRRRRRRRC